MWLISLIVIIQITLIEVKTKTNICFTWTLNRDVLRLVCTIEHLIYDVAMLDENGIEQASCLMPSSESKCFSHLSHANISQNIKTNKTVLTVWQVDTDSSFHKNWTCRHGRGKEQATVEVSVILANSSKCIGICFALTLLSLVASFLSTSAVMMATIWRKHLFKRVCLLWKKMPPCTCLKIQSRQKRLAFYWTACGLNIMLFSLLPVYLAVNGKILNMSATFCFVDGVVIGILCNLMSSIYGISGNRNFQRKKNRDKKVELRQIRSEYS